MRIFFFWQRIILPLVLFGFAGTLNAQTAGPQPWWPVQVRPLPFLHPLFTNEMVLQREVAAPVWGWSKPGVQVRLTVDGKPAGEGTADASGRWEVRVGPFSAGGPHTLAVEGGGERRQLENVLFGDVWLCSGQSNMNWPVRLSQNGEVEVQKANNPNIRSFTVGMYSALTPQVLPPEAVWEPCKSEFSKNFTGVGYFFAREIEGAQKVPVGILHASVGATAAEAWVSAEALHKQMPLDFTDPLEELAALNAPFGKHYDYFEALQKWTAAADPESARLGYTSSPTVEEAGWLDIEVPKPWKQAGIPALADFNGLVWFRHVLEVPESYVGRELSLLFSVVNDLDIVWLNGRMLGCKPQAGQHRYVVPPGYVKPGRNLLTVAVLNTQGQGGFVASPNNMVLKPLAGAETGIRLAGTWKCKPAAALKDLPPVPVPQTGHYKVVSSLYNGMIAPLMPFAIKGALWYQGEANVPFGRVHRRLLPTLIGDWRARFGQGDFPFLVVSLANYNAPQTQPSEQVGYQEVREAQWMTARNLPNVGLALAVDIGNSKDIHPRNKQEVGRRLSLVARRMVYGEKDLVASGPEFAGFELEPPQGSKLRLRFKHTGGGLRIREGEERLTGFALAGEDGEFVWADAVIDGDSVLVSSSEVSQPRHVRYGWAWSPVVNLYNKEGLPAVPFRSDEEREALLINAYACDQTVAQLAKHPFLESLKLGPKFTAKLTDACCKPLASIPNLKELTIVGTVLTYEGGLRHLKDAPKLRKLNLGRVALSEADLEKLRAALPAVEIDFTPMPEELRAQWDAWKAAGK